MLRQPRIDATPDNARGRSEGWGMMAIKRVLIVDDSPTERHVLNDMLTKAGYEVVQ
jgi:PleD family two-component response regulator